MRRLFAFLLSTVLMAGPSAAYYHYIHYTNRTAPYTPIVEKFDLRTLPDGVLTFFVSEEGPSQFLPGDEFASVLAQVNEAARAWNSVRTSELRVAFGGLYTPGTTQSAPGGEIVFEELAPGVLGLGGPTARADVSAGPGGPFVPITRAVVYLNRDLAQRPGPSHSEAFFLTVLHEMGHALGLQHTLTSSAMSTDVTRATSRAKPLDDDDIAALSLLYPTPDFAARFGSITGRVALREEGVHLASVVAIRQGAGAVSTLTNPDGTYRIDGLPPGQYFVYAHPLPPATQSGFGPANVVLPRGADGEAVAAGDAFKTVFYPGTRNPLEVTPVPVTAGAMVEGINFSVEPQTQASIYGVTTYSFFDQTAVKPAYLSTTSGYGTVVAYGAGITSGKDVRSGLGVTTLDGTAVFSPGSFRTYGEPYVFLAFDLLFNFASGSGPRHLVFRNSDDIYVLPSAVHLVGALPPSVTEVTAAADESGERVLSLKGSGLTSSTRFYFDGAPAAVRSFDSETQQALVVPPPASPEHVANILAVNPDGQTSMFVQAAAPPAYTYDSGGQPAVTITPANLRAGSEGVIEITGVNTQFADGETIAGFGSSDVAVRRLFVLSPTYALANVQVAPGAQPGWNMATVATGLQTVALPYGFEISPADAAAPVAGSQVMNAATGKSQLWPGSTALLKGANLTTLGAAVPAITLRDMASDTDVPVKIVSAAPDEISFEIPAGFPLGPTILKLGNGTDTLVSLAVLIGPRPLAISAVLGAPLGLADAGFSAKQSEPLTICLIDLAPPGQEIAANRIKVKIGGIKHPVVKGGWSTDDAGVYCVEVNVSADIPAGSRVPITVTFEDRTSEPFYITVE